MRIAAGPVIPIGSAGLSGDGPGHSVVLTTTLHTGDPSHERAQNTSQGEPSLCAPGTDEAQV